MKRGIIMRVVVTRKINLFIFILLYEHIKTTKHVANVRRVKWSIGHWSRPNC